VIAFTLRVAAPPQYLWFAFLKANNAPSSAGDPSRSSVRRRTPQVNARRAVRRRTRTSSRRSEPRR